MAKQRKMKVEEQMDMLEEGGLLDEGGTVDPVSGNDVPSGSTQEEVRDDIPAQLSEGEFVFPADVVRYIGLENLMQLRQKAKAGLQKMEDMGQMGNAEEAIMDDNGSYKDEVGSMIDNLELAQGGMVPQQNIPPIGPPVGNTMSGQVVAPPMPTTSAFQMQPRTAMNQTTRPNLMMAQGGMVGQAPNPFKKRRRTPFKKPTQNFQVGGMPQPVPTVTRPARLPTYSQFMGQTTPGQGPASPVVYGTDQYIGPNGDIIGITTINGNPIQDIPAGYKKYNPATDTPAKPAVAEPVVQERGDGDGADAREEERQRNYAGYLTELNELSTLSPDFKSFVEETLPGQKRAAETMVIDPETGLPSFPDMGFTETMKGLFSGEQYKALAEGVSGLFGENQTEKAYKDIADTYGLNIEDYTTKGLFGIEKLDKDSLRRDAMLTKAVADTFNLTNKDVNTLENIARTKFERDDEGRIDTDTLVDRSTGELTQAGKDLFGQTLSDEEEAELLGRGRDESTQPDNQSFAQPDYAPPDFSDREGRDEASNPAGDVDSGPGSGFGYAKGGAVKQTKKKGLGRLKT